MNFDLMRFGSGKPGDLDELSALVKGQGSYTSDITLPQQTYACFVRSPQAHARIKSIDISQAKSSPGVLAVLTGEDFRAAGLGVVPPVAVFNGQDGQPMKTAGIPPLAQDKVRYLGEALAIVVADSMQAALNAADLINADLESLPVAMSAPDALAPNAPKVHDQLPSNLVLDWADGNLQASDDIFAKAHHVESVVLEDPPVAAGALEPRSAIGQWDAQSQRYTLIASTQGVMVVRKLLAEGVFKIAPDQMRVITPDVGGGFGAKVQAYSEYAAVLYASKVVGRPVKWTATRMESFLSDTHGRNSTLRAQMAFDREGRIQGLKVDVQVGVGAYTSTYVAIVATNNTKNCLSSVYRIPSIYMRSQLAFTHAVPLGPYRGAGRPEAIYMIEQLLDRASQKFNLDRIEIRRRNMISEREMPYSAPNAQVYDSGDFEPLMNKALQMSDWAHFEQRRAQSARDGKLRGIGICCFLEVAGGILEETADIRFTEEGAVHLHVGAQAIGQGHLSTYPRLIADRLGIDVKDIRLVAGDSDQVPGIVPTVASRSMMMVGSASTLACDEAIARGKAISAHLLEASVDDIAFENGEFRIVGTDRALPLLKLTAAIKAARSLPADAPSTLDNLAKFTSPTMSFPNGCHICEVEIDPETGVVQILKHTAVDDVGIIMNEAVVDGQIIGGVAQGLGQILGEQMHYDSEGQLQNGSFMDYPMPRADNMPPIVLGHHVVPCRNNPLGVKGAGESGVAGAIPSAASAILDALSAVGVKSLDLPYTPQRVWQAIQQAK